MSFLDPLIQIGPDGSLTQRRMPLNAKRLTVGVLVATATLLVMAGTAFAQDAEEVLTWPPCRRPPIPRSARATSSGSSSAPPW